VVAGRWFTEFWAKSYNPAIVDELGRDRQIPGMASIRIDFTVQLCSKKCTLEDNDETTHETSIRHASVQLSFLRELLLPQRSGQLGSIFARGYESRNPWNLKYDKGSSLLAANRSASEEILPVTRGAGKR
jgi:hypothetical protein